jgi:hypothetical protein
MNIRANDDQEAGVLCSLANLPELLLPPSSADRTTHNHVLQSYDALS